MLGADARRVAEAIEERVNTGTTGKVTATVGSDRIRPQVTPPPGAARPTIVRYHIEITDGTRTARLELDDATEMLDDIEPGCEPDQLFDVISSREVPIEDATDQSDQSDTTGP